MLYILCFVPTKNEENTPESVQYIAIAIVIDEDLIGIAQCSHKTTSFRNHADHSDHLLLCFLI